MGWRSLINPRKKKKELLWWREIRKVRLMEDWKNCFKDNIGWKIGNGKCINT